MRLQAHVAALAADAMGGRAPGTIAGEKTETYIAEQFRTAGLCPAFAGSWFQDVPMVEAKPWNWRLSVRGESGRSAALEEEDLVLFSGRRQRHAKIKENPLLFVGYGISAPGLGRDDYADTDVQDKTLLILAGTPDVPAFRTNDAAFRYGFALNKAAEAGRRGAAGVLIVVPDGESWKQSAEAARERRISADPSDFTSRPVIEGRLRQSAADKMLLGQRRFAELERSASRPGFRAISLGLLVSGEVRTDVRQMTSRNVAAVLTGTERPSEHVVFTAHWDHLGTCASDASGDNLCNGAVDNASGVASLLELAGLFSEGGRPRRSVLFIATTGEEYGTIGANYYVEHPALPLADVVGGGNLDMTAGRGKGTDVVLFGAGLSEIDLIFERAASLQGRRIVRPRSGEASYFVRSDNIAFVRKGVPVLTATGLWSEGPGRDAFDRYQAGQYHKPSDDLGHIASFEGAAEDTALMHLFGRLLADSDAWPAWRSDAPYVRPNRVVNVNSRRVMSACGNPVSQHTSEPRTVFRSVNVIPMDRPGVLSEQDVIVSGRSIVAVGLAGLLPLKTSDRIIEGRGKFLMPGLWDMHVHATRPNDQDALSTALALYLSYGIVGVRDMGATLDELEQVRRALALDSSLPDLVAAGPVLDGPKRPWQPDVALPLADVAALRKAIGELVQAKVDFLKPYDGLTRDQYQALIEEATRFGLTVAGHVPKSMTFEQAAAAGQKSVEHITLKLIEDCTADGQNAMPEMLGAWLKEGYDGKYRVVDGWFTRRDVTRCHELYRRIGQHGVFVTPTLAQEFVGGEWTTPEDLKDMSPLAVSACEHQAKLIAAAAPDHRKSALDDLLKIVRELHRSGVALLAGSDASNGCVPHGRSLHKELRLLHQAGLTNQEVLETATLNAARFLGRDNEGIVRPGASANLLLLDGDPLADLQNTLRISGVMRGGHWRDRGQLEAARSAAIAAVGSPSPLQSDAK